MNCWLNHSRKLVNSVVTIHMLVQNVHQKYQLIYDLIISKQYSSYVDRFKVHSVNLIVQAVTIFKQIFKIQVFHSELEHLLRI